jgi:SAM-dependent methyltransferase
MAQTANWAELWQSMLLQTHRGKLCNTSYWDKQANEYNQKIAKMANLTEKQLPQIMLPPNATVLDVGAGTGRITIPVAKQAQQVVALEPSKNMLALLRANAQKECINNIAYIQESFDDVGVAQLGCFDVVIASFSLFMTDLEGALLKIDVSSSKAVYLFSSASPWMDAKLQEIVYGHPVKIELDYIYVYNILHDLGILANVDVWTYTSKQSFSSLEDALLHYMTLYSISQEKEHDVRKYLKSLLTEENGKIWLNQNRKAATIWWKK